MGSSRRAGSVRPTPTPSPPSTRRPSPPNLGSVVVDGLLLAAGAGTRMGRPKALVVGDDGTPWLHASIARLQLGGCRRVTVVLGAAAEEAAALLATAPTPRDGVHAVVARDWA